jgi:hypothetical protein
MQYGKGMKEGRKEIGTRCDYIMREIEKMKLIKGYFFYVQAMQERHIYKLLYAN